MEKIEKNEELGAEKPTKAIALKYDKENSVAPKVVAKGQGLIAENILNTALQNSIPVYQNKTLASMLMAVELDKEIPTDLYKAVAEVLAYVYSMDTKYKKR